jgi:hypothetical protein
MSLERPLESLSDDELLRRLADLLHQSRRAESDLVAHIAEVETRRLYAREAAPSMFAYCMDVLHLSEAEAYLRLTAARAAREHRVLLQMLADGRLHLTGIAKLAPHLTPENRALLLSRAVHKSKRQIEELVAELAPRPDVPGVLRKLPSRPTPSNQEAIPSNRQDAGVTVLPIPDEVASSPDASSSPVASASLHHEDAIPPPTAVPFSSRSLLAVTKSSSRLAPSYATSSSAFGDSCARKCRTAISPRSSRRPSRRSSSGWRPDDSVGRALLGRTRPA